MFDPFCKEKQKKNVSAQDLQTRLTFNWKPVPGMAPLWINIYFWPPECKKKKKVLCVLPTVILRHPLVCFAGAGGGLACAPGAVLLTRRGGVSGWLLLVVKLVLGDHVHLLAFQSTWITARRRGGLQNMENGIFSTFWVSHLFKCCLAQHSVCLWLKMLLVLCLQKHEKAWQS